MQSQQPSKWNRKLQDAVMLSEYHGAKVLPITNRKPYTSNKREPKLCKFCGSVPPFERSICPAMEKVCSKCGKKNYFRSCYLDLVRLNNLAPPCRTVKGKKDSDIDALNC
ncbi:unnamed protein product [Lepeophtheirus salmonis]|uniref:(salmon louse) hypothetical protein n=1 Tax=Lepeophtheirus salmonis TaxID=72036 RepID=A0A7R8CDA7_LEPSM|nr:unnamed protein product [Lepeophtheirus salmonis]CAF2779295.1 unnamed protein product [Lepeophtheirus salmonis]